MKELVIVGFAIGDKVRHTKTKAVGEIVEWVGENSARVVLLNMKCKTLRLSMLEKLSGSEGKAAGAVTGVGG